MDKIFVHLSNGTENPLVLCRLIRKNIPFPRDQLTALVGLLLLQIVVFHEL